MQKINYLNVPYGFASVLLSLPQKMSNTINVNEEAKEQGRDMQTPIVDSAIFTKVLRSVQASP